MPPIILLLKEKGTGYGLLWLMMGLCIFLGGCNLSPTTEIRNESKTIETKTTETEGEMIILAIDLQDGFEDDTVILQVNGENVYHKEDVSTKLLLGLADSFKTEVEKGPIKIDISAQTKGIKKTISLDVSADTYLGISIVNGIIEYIVSNEPFGYG